MSATDAKPTQAESSGTLTAEKVRELMEENSRQYPSPTDPYVWLTEYDWQAIADELNATLGESSRLPYWWTHDDTLHVELPKLPESISVRLPDQRDREVRSARTWQYMLGAGTCHNTQSDFDFMCSECGKCVDNGRVLGFNFCPRCGRRIVEVDE